MVKTQTRRFSSSRHLDGTLMYPGKYTLTWVRMGLVWFLVSMEPAA